MSVRACAPTSSDAEVVEATRATIHALGDYGNGLRAARKIAVKINAGVSSLVLTDGKQTEVTDPAVVEGTIRAIRDVTNAEIVIGDAPTHESGLGLYERLGYPERLAPYGHVRLVHFNEGELAELATPHPAALMRAYTLHRELAEADAFVSIAKMKAHSGLGCTLSIKNLFGWTPTSVYGSPRNYLHDMLIRLPRAIADLALLFRPCLNVVDGIVATNSSEWHGTALRPGVLLAGANCVATDAVGARIMGFDPAADHPDFPFFYRRNAIRLVADAGLGPIEADGIEVVGDDPAMLITPFDVRRYGNATDRLGQLRRGRDCVAAYQARQSDHAARYAGRYISLEDDHVVWDAADMAEMMELRRTSGRDWRNMPPFTVRCLPPEAEVEDFRWYAVDTLAAEQRAETPTEP